MRAVALTLGAVLLFVLAFWAYRENYRTQATSDQVARLQRQITELREERSIMQAEWAYLNRPARLRQLVEINHDALQLVAIDADRAIPADAIAYPTILVRPPHRPEGFTLPGSDADAIADLDTPSPSAPDTTSPLETTP